MSISLSDYTFELPQCLIASSPCKTRTGSRLLHLDRQVDQYTDCQFSDLLHLLRPNDLLIFNNTRVMKARLKGRKMTGGAVELLIERLIDDKTAKVMVKSNKSLRLPATILVGEHEVVLFEKIGGFYQAKCLDTTFIELMDGCGEIPLPPYMKRDATEEDVERYQTVYAAIDGAVAAPTAGLHFDELLLERLKSIGVDQAFITLHVGAGTFLPIKSDDIDSHTMHSEWVDVNDSVWQSIAQARSRGGRVIAVGTTSVRALESAWPYRDKGSYQADTQLFIRPPYEFGACDGMITNFHLPQSTLLMLVAAFAGYDLMMRSYEHAIASAYRFYSYGDSMLII